MRACDEAGPDPNWDRRIHSVLLATRQLVKAETVDSLLSSQTEVVILKYVATLNIFIFLYNTVAEVLVYKANGCYSAIL